VDASGSGGIDRTSSLSTVACGAIEREREKGKRGRKKG
jgi:hypothetical protein